MLKIDKNHFNHIMQTEAQISTQGRTLLVITNDEKPHYVVFTWAKVPVLGFPAYKG